MQLDHHPVLAAHPGIRFATAEQPLYPHGLVARTCVKRWMFWASLYFSPAVACGTAELTEAAAVLDKHLSTREWLVGGQASLAEYAVAAPLMTMEQAGLALDGYPNLLAWFARVKELPILPSPSREAQVQAKLPAEGEGQHPQAHEQ